MRGLKICLWITGILCLLTIFGLFLPRSSLEAIAGLFGVEKLPDSPVFLYAVRAFSATYTAIGLFYVILALQPTRFGVMVPFSGFAAAFVGIVCGITGLAVRMPVAWFLGDFLTCTILGVLILVFWRKSKQASAH